VEQDNVSAGVRDKVKLYERLFELKNILKEGRKRT
jgi:hypothetical protein